jgi:hypothetical protein
MEMPGAMMSFTFGFFQWSQTAIVLKAARGQRNFELPIQALTPTHKAPHMTMIQ